MKIAFDYQIFYLQSYGGVSRYITCLAQHLSRNNQEVRIFAPLHRNRYLQELPKDLVCGIGLQNYPPKTARICLSLNWVIAKSAISLWKPNIIHETYFSRFRSGSKNCPTIITVYDMIHELFPDKFAQGNDYTKTKIEALKRADHIICITENTRRDLIRLFDVPEEQTTTIHLGFEHFTSNIAIKHPTTVNQRPYLLFVGNRTGYKNFAGFITAVTRSEKLKKDFDIVAFGGGSFSSSEIEMISKLGFKADQVKQFSGDDHLMGQLYANARAFIYPSLYEGFGLPPLEAMAHNCPVVSSNTSSMPEVIGDAGEFFDPMNTENMIQAIENVVYSDERISHLVRMGQQRLLPFSWDQCAKKTLEIYTSLSV
ncbi:glycosyltransferase family 1 protein [Deltaproteobacteria bacterium TL4]